ncbi:MAG: phage tail protein [Holophagales bacterium]|nr:phage tail protein [Holophagales bacterium]
MPQMIRSSIMDPLLNFKFLVSWQNDSGDLTVVAGVSKIGPLTRSTEVAKYREGGAPTQERKIPGQTTYSDVKLERGIIMDVAFEQWVNKIWDYNNSGTLGQNQSLRDFRRTLKIDLCNQAGQIMNSYYVYNCWPSEYTSLPELNGQDGATVAIESMTLQNEGWVRDDTFTAPAVPDGLAQFLTPTSPTIDGVTPPSG